MDGIDKFALTCIVGLAILVIVFSGIKLITSECSECETCIKVEE